ncbi:MAG: hypothetical protein AAF617_15515 [Bacteroidota bacterium]
MLLLFVSVLMNAQERHNFNFESISINPLSLYVANKSTGFSMSGDIGLSYKTQNFLISAQVGRELDIFPSAFGESFSDIGLLWGKTFELTSWLYWDGFVGASYFYLKEPTMEVRTYDRQTTVGVPLVSKLKCMIGNYFSVGIQLRANVNALQSFASGGLALQVDF